MQHSCAAAAHVMVDRPICANCKKPMAHEWAHTRACTCNLSGCYWPTQVHRQHQRICVMGQSENLLGSHLNNLCRPMRHSCVAAHIVLDRPMRANWEKLMVHELTHVRAFTCNLSCCCGPTQASHEVHLHHRPMQAFSSAALLLAKSHTGPYGSQVRQLIVCLGGPMQSNCPNIVEYDMGTCKCLHAIDFRLLWANSSSLARSVHLHHGPTSATIPLAPHAHMTVSCRSPLCAWVD